ncbi:phospholipase d delta [Quercus suber]|uniref:phospholipase D n=1 Tax=Quercus suber TaxID=58331 RepID=A0AAW0KP62_QUESU
MAELKFGSNQHAIYLHRDLELKIVEAQHLPNLSLLNIRQLRRCFAACIGSDTIESPHTSTYAPRKHKVVDFCNPYVKVLASTVTVARTRVIKNTFNPKWNQRFHIPLAHPVTSLTFQVKDDDIFGSEVIGTVDIKASRIITGELISDWFSILGSSKTDTKIYLVLQFTPFEKNPRYNQGIASGTGSVARTYFPLRQGCSLRLYQDAHVRDESSIPKIELDGGKVYRREKCWEDIYYAISEAHHLVYIVGWSVYHKVRLVRETTRPLPPGGDLTLAEMLKYKSEEGVRVLLLIWDDKTSRDKFGIKTPGMMQTHDEEIKKFFKHSSVICVLAPRYGSSKLGYFKQQVVGNLFTHHQKCVLVDTQASGNYRKITAFLGGIDLRDGRYDTPEHRLFRDFNTVFENDYHNSTFPSKR